MAKVLKQAEVDALLNLVQQGEPEAPKKTPEEETAHADEVRKGERAGYNIIPPESVSIFDFNRPEHVSRDQLTALESLHEVFARDVSATLSGDLRTLVDLQLISVEQLTYSEFTMSVPTPTIFTSLTCSPLEGNMILDMNPAIIYPFIDRLLGGGSVEPHHIDRPFTLIEQCLINSIITKLLDQLRETWTAICPIIFRIGEMETNPSLMQIVAPNEPVILLSFEVNMGDHSGLVNLCIPYRVIEPIIEKLSQTNRSMLSKGRSEDEAASILDNIRSTEMDIAVVVAEMPVRMIDVMNLQPGDILDTGKRAEDDFLLAVGDERPFKGRPGRHRDRNALVITGIPEPMQAMLEARIQQTRADAERGHRQAEETERKRRAEEGARP